MSIEPTYDTTPTDIWTGTTSTTSSSSSNYTVTYTYTTTYASVRNEQEDLQKIKELIRKETIQKMKDTWNTFKKEFYPVPKLRPSVQLRGVCLNGRGWA